MNKKKQKQPGQTKKKSWKTVIGAVGLLALMAAVVYMIFLDYHIFEEIVVYQTQQQLLTVAKTTAGRLEEFVTEHAETLKTISLNPALKENVYQGHGGI